jgi:hypothetical protein
MKKLTILFMVLMLVLVVFATGCACEKEDNGKKLSSRPVTADQRGEQPAEEPEETTEPEEVEEEPQPEPVAGEAFCEQLSNSEIGNILGGTWSKLGDCPQRPAMPAGVDVCICSYDGPRQLYVNVETQLYDDADEAERVYNMYCESTAEESEVGTYSCRRERSSTTTPNYVYFLKGNYFVKVSCLGGTCSLNSVAELAKQVDAEI